MIASQMLGKADASTVDTTVPVVKLHKSALELIAVLRRFELLD